MKKEKANTDLVGFIPNLDSKAKLDKAASQMAQAVIDGRVDAKEAAVALDAMSKVIKAAMDSIHEHVLHELDKYHRLEKITIGRVELQRREAGTKYNYSGCGDPVYGRLAEAARIANNALKEREQFLKALPAPFTQVDEETGEISKVYPPAKSSTTTFSVIYHKD